MSTKYLITIPHTAFKPTVTEWTDYARSAIIDAANRGDGLADDRDETLIDFEHMRNYAAYLVADLAQELRRTVSRKGHLWIELALAILAEAERDDDLMAACRAAAPDFVDARLAKAARAKVVELLDWQDTNDFSLVDLVCEILNVVPDRVAIQDDGNIALDGALLDDTRLVDLVARLPN